jgi:uncharacterized protein
MTPTALGTPSCCDNGEPSGSNATLHEPISADGTPVPGQVYAVPARHGRAVRLQRGQTLRIVNTHGTQVCDLWAFHAADFSEFMSMPHARAFIDRIVPRAGDPLVTNRRRAILTLLADTSPGVHDTLIAACDIDRYRLLGVAAYHDNCADNLRLALKAIGLRSGEVPAPLNLWMNIPVGADRGIRWLPTVSKPGDHVELRAELDCVVVMSACPQDIIVINGLQPRELHFVVAPAG